MKRGKQKEQQPKKGWRERLAGVLDLPVESVMALPHLELSGNKEILLENCHGIIGYGEDEIRVSTGRGIIRVCGEELTLKNLRIDSMIINGNIHSVEFVL